MSVYRIIGPLVSEASLGGEKAVLGFGQDRIRTLVSMATYSSHRVIIGKRCCHFFSTGFHPIIFILAGSRDMHESLEEFDV